VSQAVVKKLNHVKPHPNADKLDLAYIGGWQLVVPKGRYKSGDLVTYIAQDSIVPERWLKEWGLSGKLAGSHHNRVKAIRLRGEVSIGIVAPVPDGYSEGDNVSEYYHITKYEPPVPVCLRGKAGPRPRTFIKYDIENINNILEDFAGVDVYVTSKIHGTNAAFGLVDGEFYVCSRNMSLLPGNSVYWQIANKYQIEDKIRTLWGNPKSGACWVHGEIFGNVQDLKYGLNNDIDIRIFDIRADDYWYPYQLMVHMCNGLGLLPTPLLYQGPFDMEVIKSLANANERISGHELHVEEGVVIRPVKEQTYGTRGSRLIAKYINPEYLLRGGDATEYH